MAVRCVAKGLFGIGIPGVDGWTMLSAIGASPRDGYVSLKAVKLGAMIENGDEFAKLRLASVDSKAKSTRARASCCRRRNMTRPASKEVPSGRKADSP